MADTAIFATAMLILPSAHLLTRVAIDRALVANLVSALKVLATLRLLVDSGPAITGIGWLRVSHEPGLADLSRC